MSDAVMVPREPFMPTVTLSPDAAVTIAGGEVVAWKECLRRLAASPSVGGWEGSRPQEAVPTEQAEVAVVDYTPWVAEWFENAADWVVMGAVQNDDVHDINHQPAICTLSDWVSGKEARVIAAAPDLLAACQLAVGPLGSTGPTPAYEAVLAAIAKATTPQPADGCSSNEGADGWTIWHGGPNPAPGQIVSAIWNGEEHDDRLSDDLDWDWNDTSDPITAYRILPQTEKGA